MANPPLLFPHSGKGAEILEYLRLALNLPDSLVALDFMVRVGEPIRVITEYNATEL